MIKKISFISILFVFSLFLSVNLVCAESAWPIIETEDSVIFGINLGSKVMPISIFAKDDFGGQQVLIDDLKTVWQLLPEEFAALPEEDQRVISPRQLDYPLGKLIFKRVIYPFGPLFNSFVCGFYYCRESTSNTVLPLPVVPLQGYEDVFTLPDNR